MVRDGVSLPAAAFTNAGVPGYRGSDPALVNVPLLAQEFSRGASVILKDLSSCWRPVTDFCRRLSYELGRPVGAGAFLTPAGAQGFGHHYDMYSIFAVQLSGRKTWQLYRPAWNLPLELLEQSWQNGRLLSAEDRRRIAHGEPDMVVDLAAGDVLWLPRGWIHNVFATDDTSLHLTIQLHGLTEHRMVDALKVMLAQDEDFRGALPVDFVRSPETAGPAAQEFLAKVGARISAIDPGDLTQVMADRIRASWYPPRCQPVSELLLTDADLAGYDGLRTVREAVLGLTRTAAGGLAIDTGHRQLILEADAAGLVGPSLEADDERPIPLRRCRDVLGEATLPVLRQLLGSGVAMLVTMSESGCAE